MIRFFTPVVNFARVPLTQGHLFYRSKRGHSPSVRIESIGKNQTPEGAKKWTWDGSKDAVISHSMLMSVLLLGSQSHFYHLNMSEAPYFAALAGFSMYIGAHRSLNAPKRQPITLRESLLAPVFVSAALFGIYSLMKHFPNFKLQTLIDIQISIVGTIAVSQFLQPFLKKLLFLKNLDFAPPTWLLKDSKNAPVTITGSRWVGGLLALPLLMFEIFTGHQNFTLNNFLACCLAIEVLQALDVESFKAAATLGLGLLFYDVFWVFFSEPVIGENVMLTVATSSTIEGPLKLLLPSMKTDAAFHYSLLGLGDIVLPGALAALLLRFDASRCDLEERKRFAYAYQESEVDDSRLMNSRIYFWPVLASYLVGLFLAFAANRITKMGQPALLYIVPCMLLTSLARAASRSELWTLINHQSLSEVQEERDQ